MIISRTPYRISFFGGGTDYPAWYRQHGAGDYARARVFRPGGSVTIGAFPEISIPVDALLPRP